MGNGKRTFTAVGVMSGTSVDGLDMALCRFTRVEQLHGDAGAGSARVEKDPYAGAGSASSDNNPVSGPQWHFEILKTKTLSYSGTSWPERLAGAETADGYTLAQVHRDFGRFTGEAVKEFLAEGPLDTTDQAGPASPRVDLIASHGHTIFHRPEKQITLQIGDGAEIAAVTGITAVSDFRRLDVALGGQGAPLVPIGDELLFGQYGYCLNLGGFANVSFRESGKRIAFDICPVNIVLNRLARQLGMEYDKDGAAAASGEVDRQLLAALEGLDFYRLDGPRSLGKEWVDEVFMPVVDASDASVEDKLRTVCEHVALRIADVIAAKPPHPDIIDEERSAGDTTQSPGGSAGTSGDTTQSPGDTTQSPGGSAGTSGRDKLPGSDKPDEEFLDQGATGAETLLVTGGGAKNVFLRGLISERASPVYTVIPDERLVDFKEAVVFAFLGVLRMRNEINCLAAVTGARQDCSGGIVHRA